MSAPPRPPSPPHRWRDIGYRTVRIHVLHRSQLAPAFDVLTDVGTSSAYLTECEVCGLIEAYVHRFGAEVNTNFRAYGMDVDSLGIAHSAPRCEVLRMPSAAEEPAGEALVA